MPVKEKIIQSKQYRLEDEINLYELLPVLSFSIQESTNIISDLDGAKVQMGKLWNYIRDQRKEQQYNDYKGVAITAERFASLKSLIRG